MLDLESELHNIEQGVNQLQNIPTFAEDSWPNADAFSTTLQPSFPPPAFAPYGAIPAAFSNTPVDPFGDSFNPNSALPSAISSYQMASAWPHISSVHSAPNFQSIPFSVRFFFVFL